MLQPALQQWEQEGAYYETTLFQHKVFYKQYGNPNAASSKTLLLIHGFPESSYSYHKIVEGMSKIFDRIVLFDMLGYGLSDKPTENYTYSLFEQADVALQIWNHVGVKGGHLLSHDMGDSVATELVARHVSHILPAWFSDGFQSFTFSNGNMVLKLATFRVTQPLLLSSYGHLVNKIFNFKLFNQQIRSAHGEPTLSDEDIKMLWHNLELQNGDTKLYLTIQYLNDRKRFETTRWLPSLSQVKLPIHVCWGDKDAVSEVKIAHYLKENVCPSATLTIMPDVGHFCQLSHPDVWIKSMSAFYSSLS